MKKEKLPNIGKVVKALRKGEVLGNASVEQLEFARKVLDAEEFMNNYIKENGTKSFVSERLRDGYIGKETKQGSGTVIQSVRGKPYGTIIAIPTKGVDGSDSIVTGISYLDNEDRSFPVLGQYIALKRALDGKKDKKIFSEIKYVKPKARLQITRFEKRALIYFYPDKYSYTRGSDPISCYDAELQKRRLFIMGEEEYNKSVCVPRTKEQLEKIRNGDSNFKPGN